MLGDNGLELILKGSTVYTCGSYRGGEVHHSWPKGEENSLAFTCIKRECPGHPQSRGGGGILRVSNDCCINLWMRKNKLFVHYMYTSF